MSTATQDKPAGKTAFEFDANGTCTNPEKIIIRCNMVGAACAILVAYRDGKWMGGFQCGGRNVAYVTIAPHDRDQQWRFGARSIAMRYGAERCLDYIKGLGEPAAVAIRDALNREFHPDGHWAPGPNQFGFKFDAEGECTNPERINMPVPKGRQGALLLAQMANGQWIFGYVLAPKGEELKKYPCKVRSEGEAERHSAIMTACGAAILATGNDTELMEMLENWGSSVANGKSSAAAKNFGAGKSGDTRDAGPAGVTPARTDPTSSAEGETNTRKSPVPSVGSGVGEPISQGEPKPDSAPSAEVSAILPGLAHKADEQGVFMEDCDKLEVPMPKKARALIRLALCPDGTWRVGTDCGCTAERVQTTGCYTPCKIEGEPYAERAAALLAGIETCLEYFNGYALEPARKAGNRAAEALHAFRAKVVSGEAGATETPAAPRAPMRVYTTEFSELPLSCIQNNPKNHRRAFSAAQDREMADSMLAEGLHQPIAVRKLLEGEKPEGELVLGDPGAPTHELIFGHRRRRGWEIANRDRVAAGGVALPIPCKIYHGLTREQASSIALVENLQRVNINAMEEAEGYEQLMADEGLTQEQAAERVGRPRSTVAKALRMLKLPAIWRDAVRENKLTSAHASAIFRFVPATESQRTVWAAEVPNWEKVVTMLAELAIEKKVTAEYLEKGVPFIYELVAAGLAARINSLGEFRIGGKQKEHAAYFAVGDGDWVCFNPPHWEAEVAARRKAAAEREERERLAKQAELEKLAKGGRKQLNLAELDRSVYREFSPDHEALLTLVPDEKKAAAKGDAGRTTVVTDVQLADRLQKAMLRAIRKNREDAVAGLEEKVRKKIAALKKVGPRELAWLVFLIADTAGRTVHLHLMAGAAKSAGVKLPSAAISEYGRVLLGSEHIANREKRLGTLAKCEGADLVRVLMAERLPSALQEIVTDGPDSTGGRFVKWWLDTDTLWLLEETPDGRKELVEVVKNSPWYAKAMAGEGEGEE